MTGGGGSSLPDLRRHTSPSYRSHSPNSISKGYCKLSECPCTDLTHSRSYCQPVISPNRKIGTNSLSTSRVPNPALQLINLLLNYSHLRTQWSSSSTDRPGRRARPACASPLIEKGVDAEVVNVDLAKGEHLAESYLEMQPFGKVPVLQDTETGVQVFESRAIAQYIIAKYRGQGAELAPPESDLKAYALYQQAMSIEQSYFDPPIAQLAYEKVWKSMKGEGETDDERVKALLAQLDQTLQGYERVLSKQKYLAGDEVTFADLSHLPYGVFVEQFGFADLIAKYPRSKSTGRT
ncbi:hypothetical protein V6Z96_009633 [Aspergillus fumigatus]